VPRVELELEIEQIATMLEELSPGDLETLEILLNPELRGELKKRREEARIELKQGKALSKDELFSD